MTESKKVLTEKEFETMIRDKWGSRLDAWQLSHPGVNPPIEIDNQGNPTWLDRKTRRMLLSRKYKRKLEKLYANSKRSKKIS